MGEVHTPPDRIYAWVWRDENTMRHNWRGAIGRAGEGQNPYLRATPARESAEDLVDALEPMVRHAIERCSDAPEWKATDTVSCIFTIEELQKARAVLARVKGEQP